VACRTTAADVECAAATAASAATTHTTTIATAAHTTAITATASIAHTTAIANAAAITDATPIPDSAAITYTAAIAHTSAITNAPITGEVLSACVGATAKLLARLRALTLLSAAELLLARRNAVPRAFAVLGVMTPVAIADVGAIEVVVLVDVDVYVAATPVAIAPERTADRQPHAEGEQRRPRRVRVIGIRGVGRIRPRAVDSGRVILWNVDNLRIRRLDLDDGRTAFLRLSDVLFLAGLQVAGRFRPAAQSLDRLEH